MSEKWCTTTNKEWQVLQHDICDIAIQIGDEIQGITDHLQKCNECGCENCIAHIDYLKVRLGGLCDHIGLLQKEMAEVLSIKSETESNKY